MRRPHARHAAPPPHAAAWLAIGLALAACAGPSPDPLRAAPPERALAAAPASAAPPAVPSPAEPAPASPSPAASAAPAALTGDWVPFVSNREGPDFDLFLYNPDTDQVLSPPGANTPGDEDYPTLSANGRWLVFQTDWPHGDLDVRLYDLVTRRINLLPALNTRHDERAPAVDNAPGLIAYTRREGRAERLHLYDLATRQDVEVVAASRLAPVILDPYLAGDKSLIAFTAAIDGGDSEIYLYDLARQTVFTPPHVNSRANEFDPALSDDNRRVVYLSDRGSPPASPDLDVFITDWRTGYTDNLPLSNATADERAPYFYKDGVVFVSDRGDGSRYFYYDMKRHWLDTWPIAHEPGADDL